MITIVDYAAGNIKSVTSSLSRLGAEYMLSDDPSVLENSEKVLLPGVGNAAIAMADLQSKGLADAIRRRRKPLLGICVGMQVLCRHSEEGNVDCIGLFDATVRRFNNAVCKVPHMGWNNIANLESKLFKNINEGAFLYFVHSYFADLCTDTVATCRYGDIMFSAALKYENYYGTQFHPEKSGDVGETVLKNFLSL